MKAIGIDIGATNIRIGIGSEDGIILRRVQEITARTGGRFSIAKQIIRMIKSFNLDFTEINGIGIGSIGPLDIRRGVVLVTPNLPFNNIPIKEPLAEVFKTPIRVLNDCSAAVLGEKMFGAGKGIKNLVYITISSGIGCGAYIDNRLVLGKDGNATEMGHSIIDMAGKLLCDCGKRGHWEAYCSGRNIPNYAKLWMKEKDADAEFKMSKLAEMSNRDFKKIDAKMIFKASKEGDELSLKIVKEIGRLNAIGITNVISAYNPELITIGGSVPLKNPALILEPVKRFVKKFSINHVPKIKITPLGHDVVLYGAIAMNFMDTLQ